MNRVFLDTVGLIALWDESGQWHAAAATAFQQIKTSSAVLYSTTFVMLECGNAAARRPYRGAVDRLRKALETASCLLHPNEDEWKDAWGAYAADPVGGPGIVDHVSFVAMRKLAIQKAFTNDRHFGTAGFQPLF